MSDQAPIGVFDSGVGGLSVLREIRRLLPGESVVYLADQAWVPYGERTLDEVRERSIRVVEELLGRGSKLVVVACNSASAAALHHLRELFPGTPFVGMEPAVKPAAALSGRGVVGVLATTATFQGELYASAVDRHASGVRIVEQAGAGLVDLIERGEVHGPEMRRLLVAHLEPMQRAGIDTLVLGCTHYPFLIPLIEDIVGDGVRLVDPSPAVARQVGRVLEQRERASADAEAGTEFLTTGDPAVFATQVQRLLGESPQARRVDL